MKRRNREVSIFSMSALDLFASALGAFILIAVVMIPHFPNIGMASQSDLDAALDRLELEEGANDELRAIREELERALQGERAAAARELAEAQAAVAAAEERAARLQQELQDHAALEREREQLQRELAVAQAAAASAEAQATAAQRELSEAQETLAEGGDRERALREALEREQRRKFLLVTISWEGRDDVDLHVVDPSGNEFYYGARVHGGSGARFEEDTICGPGNEVWLHPQVTPGEYRIYYHLFRQGPSANCPAGSPSGGAVTVRGSVVHSIDRDELPPRRLRQRGDKPLVATVVVDADANVEVQQ